MSPEDFQLFVLFSFSCFILFSCGVIAGALLGKMK